MNKIKIIALYGKSGSGKDTIQKWLVSNFPDSNGIVSCTTRPPRDYEIDGKDYFFLSTVEFGEKVLNGDMLEATSFRDWMYGTSLNSLKEDKINIGVFNPEGLECLLQDSRLDVLPIFIDADDKVRLIRNLNRERYPDCAEIYPDCAEICRRYFTDAQDFEDISFFSLVYNNNNFKKNFNDIIKLIYSTNFINQKSFI